MDFSDRTQTWERNGNTWTFDLILRRWLLKLDFHIRNWASEAFYCQLVDTRSVKAFSRPFGDLWTRMQDHEFTRFKKSERDKGLRTNAIPSIVINEIGDCSECADIIPTQQNVRLTESSQRFAMKTQSL